MIYYFADDHYQSFCGRHIYEKLKHRGQIKFYENDLSALSNAALLDDCELIILNLIGGYGDLPHAGPEAEAIIKRYCQNGGNLLLLHGGSAAFHQWRWWRRIVGMRWVRANDPDGAAVSVHPVLPYTVRVCQGNHALSRQLRILNLPTDEIYTRLHQESKVTALMETTIGQERFVQCYICRTPWNGQVVGFLPGHRHEAIQTFGFIENIDTIIDYLLIKHEEN